uniref:U2A'/phosphoprotein 32 family A C-terminal domain-containing protein n=1 Tax=Ciona savignyi TaxID=51511 RepID=H2YW49_CIOSA
MSQEGQQMTVSLVQKRNVQIKKDSDDDNDDDYNLKITEALINLTHVRLDREGITAIENLDWAGNVTNLYLQHNLISEICNLEPVAHSLRFLTLAGNQISKLGGLLSLKVLALLDLSENIICQLDVEQLPESLVFVSFKENECCNSKDYREKLITHLPKLISIDGEEISEDDESTDEEDKDLSGSEENDEDTLRDAANEVLLRSESRLQLLEEEHHSRIHEINSKNISHQVEGLERKNRKEEEDITEFQEQIRKVLNQMVQAEHAVMHNFELPKLDSPKPPTPVEPDVDLSVDAQVKPSTPKNAKKTMNFVSTGTTTSNSSKPPTDKPSSRPTSSSRTQFGVTSPTSNTRYSKSPQPPTRRKQSEKSLPKSKSMIRIPGSRPFSKP